MKMKKKTWERWNGRWTEQQTSHIIFSSLFIYNSTSVYLYQYNDLVQVIVYGI